MENKRGRPPKYLIAQLQALHDDVKDIKTVLKGYNGDEGLCEQVKNNSKAINRIWIAIAAIIVSIGGTGYGLLQALTGG